MAFMTSSIILNRNSTFNTLSFPSAWLLLSVVVCGLLRLLCRSLNLSRFNQFAKHVYYHAFYRFFLPCTFFRFKIELVSNLLWYGTSFIIPRSNYSDHHWLASRARTVLFHQMTSYYRQIRQKTSPIHHLSIELRYLCVISFFLFCFWPNKK